MKAFRRALRVGASAGLFLATFCASAAPIDSKVWASGAFRFPPAWIDAKRVLFMTGAEFKFNERLHALAIWDVRGKARIYRADVHDYCYKDGVIAYKVVDRDDPRLIRGTWYAGSFGEEKPVRKDVEGDSAQLYDRLNCRFDTMEARRLEANRTNRRVIPLLAGHGHLDLGERLGAQSMLNEPAKFHRVGAPEAIILPFGTREVYAPPAYYPFAATYVLRAMSHDPEGRTKAADIPVWLLKPDGQVVRRVIPRGPWTVPDELFPSLSAAGLLFVRHRGSHDRSDGIYLVEAERAKHLLPGRVTALGISPDGCAIAFSHAPTIDQDRADKKNRRTMKVIQLCSGR